MHTEVPADSLVDTQLLVDWLGFVARSVWRHRILAVATCLVAFGAVWIAAAQWPKTYQSVRETAGYAKRRDVVIGQPGTNDSPGGRCPDVGRPGDRA